MHDLHGLLLAAFGALRRQVGGLAERQQTVADELRRVAAEKPAVGPMPDHEWRGTELRFEKPDGEWGEFVDLQGPRGRSGGVAVAAPAGAGGADLGALPDASSDVPAGFVVQQNGQWRRATYAQMQAWFPSGGVTGGGAVVTVNGQVVTVS